MDSMKPTTDTDRDRYNELVAILSDEELLRLKKRSHLRKNNWLERILETELNKRGIH